MFFSFRNFKAGLETKDASASGSNAFSLSFLKIDLKALRIEGIHRSGIDYRTAYRVLMLIRAK